VAGREARQHLEAFQGGTKDIGGRIYLCFKDYLRWPRRKLLGDLGALAPPEPGLVIKSWNGWAEACSRAGDPYVRWVTVGDLPHPDQHFGDAAMNTMEDEAALEGALAARQQALAGLFQLGREAVRARGEDEKAFVPSELQRRIRAALYRKQLTTEQLLATVGSDRKQLFGRWGLPGLMERGLVKNDHDRKGYYRPDAPPLLDDTASP
jgi:hypothetical protein